MPDVRRARLIEAAEFSGSRWLRFELADDRPFEFSGGQYVIIDTTLILPDRRPRRRAYSMLSPDRERRGFELGTYRLPGGLGCDWLCRLELGQELEFTGPWGKLRAPQGPGGTQPIWIIATDSGASAALGLCRSEGFASALARTRLAWWTTTPDYFLEREWLVRRAGACAEIELRDLPPIGSAERIQEASRRVLERLAQGKPEQVYLLGDGNVTRHLAALLVEHGVDAAVLQTESFFNHLVSKRVASSP